MVANFMTCHVVAGTARCRAWMATFWHDLTVKEISGSFGDLGTLLPLLVGMVNTNGLDLGTTLIFTGVYNIITGAAFGLPMPVQPMKTIAAVALSGTPLTIPQISAAGMFVGGSVLVLGATRMMGLAQSLIPMAVIRGMQLGLGLDLAKKGFQQVWYVNSKAAPARRWWGVDGLCLGLFALLFILLTVYTQRDSSPPGPEPLLPTASSAACGPEALAVGEQSGVVEADGDDKVDASPSAATARVAPPACSGGEDASGSTSGGSSTSADTSEREHAPILVTSHPNFGQWRRGAARQRVHGWLQQLQAQLAASVGGSGATGGQQAAGGCAGWSRGFQIPAALLIVVIGIVITIVANPDIVHALRFGPSKPQIVVPSGEDWRIGIVRAGLPQLSLTTFNSVISVCQLAHDLFPDKPASPDAVAASVGAMNLVGGWFGAMPACHGAGGLAAQARFGARSGAAPIFLGLVKLSLGLLFGSSLFLLLQSFPQPLMGAMLVYAGVQLAACARGQRGERGMAVMLLTATVSMAMSNVAIGVAAGLIAAYSLLALDLLRERALPRLRSLFGPPASLAV